MFYFGSSIVLGILLVFLIFIYYCYSVALQIYDYEVESQEDDLE